MCYFQVATNKSYCFSSRCCRLTLLKDVSQEVIYFSLCSSVIKKIQIAGRIKRDDIKHQRLSGIFCEILPSKNKLGKIKIRIF